MYHINSQKRIYLDRVVYFVTAKTKYNYPYFNDEILANYMMEIIKIGCIFKQCELLGFVIIPDHIHMLIKPTNKYNISAYLHFIKRHSSRNINLLISKNLVGEDGHPRLRFG